MQSVTDQISAALEQLKKKNQSPELLRKHLLKIQSAAAAGIRTVDAGDNRKDQLNPNNDAFWQARGFQRRPDDWKSRITVK